MTGLEQMNNIVKQIFLKLSNVFEVDDKENFNKKWRDAKDRVITGNYIHYFQNKIRWSNTIFSVDVKHNEPLLNNIGNMALGKFNEPSEHLIKGEQFDDVLKYEKIVELDPKDDLFRLDSKNLLNVANDKRSVLVHKSWFNVDYLWKIREFINATWLKNEIINYFVEDKENGSLFIDIIDRTYSETVPRVRIVLLAFNKKMKGSNEVRQTKQ